MRTYTALLTTSLLTASAHAGFYGLGENTYSQGISGDGTTVIGSAHANATTSIGTPFTWTLDGGKTMETTQVNGLVINKLRSVAKTGTTYIGELLKPSELREYLTPPPEAQVVLRQGTNYTQISKGEGDHYDIKISRDGSTIIGTYYKFSETDTETPPVGWVWKNGAFQNYSTATGFHNEYHEISADGKIIVGTSRSDERSASSTEAPSKVYRWNESGAAKEIALPSAYIIRKVSLSEDGDTTFITCSSDEYSERRIFKHQESTGTLTDISKFSAIDPNSPYDINPPTDTYDPLRYSQLDCSNADGSMAAGAIYHAAWHTVAGEAIIWDSANGIRLAKDLITAAGEDLTGWELWKVSGISSDGRTITGTGSYNGINQAWVFTAVPEPSTYGLVGAGALALAAVIRRRSKRT